MVRQKSFALINVVGLSLGIWCALMIALWIADEWGKDAFHANGDRIGLVMTNITNKDGSIDTWGQTGYPVAEAIGDQVPGIEAVVRISGPRESILRTNGTSGMTDTKAIGAEVLAADHGFFEVFSFPLVEGRAGSCLGELKNVVLSEKMAAHCFPEGDPVGKSVHLMVDETMEPFIVSGVFKDIHPQSTLRFDAVMPIDNFLPMNNKSWGNTWVRTFVLNMEKTDMAQLGQTIKNLPAKVGGDRFRTLSLQPFEETYLYARFEDGQATGGRIDYVILFAIIALFTLLIACFNFINLTTARSIKRLREVGIKKVLGAGRGLLIGQFFMESATLVSLSVVVALLLAMVSLPLFNNITEKELYIDFYHWQLYAILGIISVGTVLLSGLYPALSLSNLGGNNPLHEKMNDKMGGSAVRKGLVVVQFSLCMLMMTGTVIVYLQLRYIRQKDLGIDKEHIVSIPMDNESYLQSQAMKAELAKFSGIEGVSSASTDFISDSGSTSDPVWEGGHDQDGQKWFSVLTVDFDLVEMLNISVGEGRSFSPRFSRDTLNYMVNRKAAQVMGLKNPIGTKMHFWGDEGGTIIGVTDNFHFASLHNPIGPMIIRCRPKETELFYVKVREGRTSDALAYMEKVHSQFSGLPFTYDFLDATMEKGYRNEQKIKQLAGIFAALAIVIASLGLFGLVMFTANQRIKEIAIRKVLGADVARLFQVLSGDLLKWVAIALLIALPIAWYGMNRWIQGFAFHVALEWWMFALSGGLLLLIALLTVSYRTLKVASINPSKSLRTE